MSTRTDSMLGRVAMLLFKVLVVFLAIFLLLNLFWIPKVGRFGCSLTPWFFGVAQADSGDCPAAMSDAWNNAQ